METEIFITEQVTLTENQIADLSIIASKYLYLGVNDEGRMSYNGIIEVLKKYESIRNQNP